MATLVPVCDGEHADVVIVELTGQGLHIANVYNANPQDTSRGVALVRAQKTVKDKKMILCGDLNLHSHMWDSRKSESRDCSLILDWLSEDDVTLLNEPDDNTCFHSKESPSVIDLAFASSTLLGQTGCTTKVMKELNCGSDHLPPSTTVEGIQIDDVVRATRHNMNRLDTKKFTRACARENNSLHAREPLREEDIEALAADLIKAMTKALDEAALKALGKGTGKRWWNPQCTDAVREMRSAWRRTVENSFLDTTFDVYKGKRKVFQAEIRTAKRELWRQTIENMTEAADVFKMVNRLGKPSLAGGLPPLTQDGVMKRTPQEKAEALLDTHIQPVEDWTEGEEEANPRARLWDELTSAEVRDAVFHAGNTAPGEDGIPNTAWKLAWPTFGQCIVKLFNCCLEVGYHPRVFKSATMVAIPKPHRDRTLPRSYRLISLLSTLGKSLERAVARKLSTQAVELQIIPVHYASAVPRRAATDLTWKLADVIMGESKLKKITSLVTFDIKGAFDAVKKERLIARLRSQRWPESLCKWVASFLTDRQTSSGRCRVLGTQTMA
ncbi:Endonuclease [Ceratocystis platani]|uniref:Endonuclease n=1 Tax=Ceratocystis fimbriata f. sp. platani TaxID=88771 RepID=A0A0F8AZ17_CERFI|nr:Endonuclease [Ceratocystis platani]